MSKTNKTALVTGANKGIGFEAAIQLAQQGLTVWVGSRDEARGRAAVKELAVHGDVRFVQLDVTSPASITAAAAHVASQTPVLDVLINNAAIGAPEDGPPTQVSPATLARTFETNFTGAWLVIQAFLPLVRKSDAGRIVNVSSTLGSLTTLSDPTSALEPLANQFANFAYASSKTALNALTKWLSRELRGTNIKVNSVCPGYNSTDMNGHAEGSQHPSLGAKVLVNAATLGADGPSGSFLDASGVVTW